MGCFSFGPNAPVVLVGLAGNRRPGYFRARLNQSGL
jgi:hypothetical protein